MIIIIIIIIITFIILKFVSLFSHFALPSFDRAEYINMRTLDSTATKPKVSLLCFYVYYPWLGRHYLGAH